MKCVHKTAERENMHRETNKVREGVKELYLFLIYLIHVWFVPENLKDRCYNIIWMHRGAGWIQSPLFSPKGKACAEWAKLLPKVSTTQKTALKCEHNCNKNKRKIDLKVSNNTVTNNCLCRLSSILAEFQVFLFSSLARQCYIRYLRTRIVVQRINSYWNVKSINNERLLGYNMGEDLVTSLQVNKQQTKHLTAGKIA